MTKDELNLGIFSWFGFIMPLRERLRLIKKVGFKGVSIWWEDEEGDFPVKKEDIPRLVSSYELEFENIHAPFSNCSEFWSDNREVREKIVNKHIQWIKECREFAIPLMVMHVTEDFKLSQPNKYGIDSIEKIAKAAEENNVKVAIENTDNKEFIHYLLSNINSPNLGLCFDSSHNAICLGKEIDLLKLYGHRLFTTHISDNDGIADRHWIPYEGNIDWEKIKESFPLDSYNKYISMEVFTKEEDKIKGQKNF